MPRLYCPLPLQEHLTLELPAQAAKHVQVLRLQPTDRLTLFNGQGGEYEAEIVKMGKQVVSVRLIKHTPVEREPTRRVQLLVGMPANDRMDWLVEKATELGVSRITPVMTQRSVLKLNAQRGERKTTHWLSIAQAACEQCGRNTVPHIDAPQSLETALNSQLEPLEALRWVLSPQTHPPLTYEKPAQQNACKSWIQILSGPEGGLHPDEVDFALFHGFKALSLGPRILRAETAALLGLVLALGETTSL